MNRINKLTILLLSITGSILLTGCSSTDKKLVQQHTASTFEYGIPEAYFGVHSKYYLDRYNIYNKSEYDTQHVYGMGTSILEIASNKPTKLSFTECGEINYTHPKIINVACYPENSAKLTIDGNGDLQILPQNGHIRTEIIVEAENGLKQHFLAYFVNKKATPIECLYSKDRSFGERVKWFVARARDMDVNSEWDIDEHIQLRKELVAFIDGLRKDKEASPSKNKEWVKMLPKLSNDLTSNVKNLKLLKQRLAGKSSKNKIHSKNKSKQLSVSGQANHQAQSEALRQDLTNAQYIMFARPTPENFKKYRIVLDKVLALGEQLGDAWETTNFPELKNIREYIEEQHKLQL